MENPIKKEPLSPDELLKIRLENMVKVLDVFDASIRASFNETSKKDDTNASSEETNS